MRAQLLAGFRPFPCLLFAFVLLWIKVHTVVPTTYTAKQKGTSLVYRVRNTEYSALCHVPTRPSAAVPGCPQKVPSALYLPYATTQNVPITALCHANTFIKRLACSRAQFYVAGPLLLRPSANNNNYHLSKTRTQAPLSPAWGAISRCVPK
jgi:hypothetical protein